MQRYVGHMCQAFCVFKLGVSGWNSTWFRAFTGSQLAEYTQSLLFQCDSWRIRYVIRRYQKMLMLPQLQHLLFCQSTFHILWDMTCSLSWSSSSEKCWRSVRGAHNIEEKLQEVASSCPGEKLNKASITLYLWVSCYLSCKLRSSERTHLCFSAHYYSVCENKRCCCLKVKGIILYLEH